MRRVLVVANKTLLGKTLLEAVRKKAESEPCEFWLLVPATPLHEHQAPARYASMSGLGVAFPQYGADDGRRAHEAAERRLEEGIERLRELGVAAGGEVGDPDPMDAITEVVAHRPVDEIMISTLPARASHWLHVDLPHRVQREHHLPVTTVPHTDVPAPA